jgi:Domain of unknown function (DUF4153)
MKFPSITTLRGELLKTLRRWPLTILLAVIGTWLLMKTSDRGDDWYDDHDHLWRMIDGCYMTMLFTIAATVFAEVKGLRVVVRVLLLVLALGLGLAFFFTLPESTSPRLIRILVLGLAIHWLIAVIPYVRPDSGPNGFWDYNRKLFLRALQTMLYALTLYVGAALALLAIEHLFGVDVRSSVYEHVWWFLSGTFSTVFFLAGFPRVFTRPETIDDYPRGLKVFTQFVLLPLVTIYLVILYAYLFKIIFTAHWPSGWVSWLVLGFAVAGIFALLLIYPLRKEEGNRWINTYARFFYLALIPLIVLLWIAISKRIGSHGITELRYYVLVLGVWLAAMACYFVFSSSKDIRVIPASLCLLALLSLWGPWSAGGVSLAVQRGRLRAILEKDGLFAGGKVQPAKAELPLEDRQTISSIVDYLIDMHGYRVFADWFRNDLDSLMRKKSIDHKYDFKQSTAMLDLMGVEYASRYATMETDHFIECEVGGGKQAIRLDSAGYVFPQFYASGSGYRDPEGERFFCGADSVWIRLDAEGHQVLITRSHGAPQLAFDLGPIERLLGESGKSISDLTLSPPEMTVRNGSCVVYFTNISARLTGTTVHTYSVRGNFVLGK